MKKLIILALFSILLPVSLYPQAGYKEFLFNQTTEVIQAKVSDLEEGMTGRFAALDDAMFYVFSDKYKSVPGTSSLLEGELTLYESESNDTKFWFLSDRLIAVELWFYDTDILKDLQKKYGARQTVSGVYVSYEFETVLWENDPKRIIVWEKASGWGAESVTYIEGTLYAKIKKASANKLKSAADSQSNRLD